MYTDTATLIFKVAKDLGVEFAQGDKLLDFGCGRGELTLAFERLFGAEAYGVDVRPCWLEQPEAAVRGDKFRVIEQQPYRIPFPDNTFDFITSTSVFEHVLDPETCFKEIYRVLKPGGKTLHIFPGPWAMPVEPHIHVPLGGVIQSRWWLSLWAWLGVRNEFQQGKLWREVVELNLEYCRTGIHYEPLHRIHDLLINLFGNVRYPKHEYLRHSHGGFGRLARRFRIPFLANFVFACRERTVFLEKPRSAARSSGQEQSRRAA